MTDQSVSDAWQGKPIKRNPARGIILTIPQMAQFLGCSSKHVRELVECGAPVYERGGRAGGKAHQLNSHEFMNWRDAWRDSQKIGRPKGPVDEAKARIQNANAEKAELELQLKRGDLFHLWDWAPYVDDMMVSCRVELCHIPSEFREQFAEPPPINVAVRWLTDRIVATLNRLASGLKRAPDEVGSAARPAAAARPSRRNSAAPDA